MKVTKLEALRNELIALEDWLIECRERKAEVIEELKIIGYLDSPPQAVIQFLHGKRDTDGWRQQTEHPKGLMH